MKLIFYAAIALLVGLCASAEALQSEKIYRIGYLSERSRPTPATPDFNLESLRDGMHELGYIDGKNIHIEPRFAGGKNEHLAHLAAQLVQLKADVIVSAAIQPSLAAKNATSIIPVVFAGVGDPVAWGLVKSLARPGGNITGLTNFAPELSGKRVELLKETIPRISRLAVLRDPRQPPQSFVQTERAARSLGLSVQSFEIRNGDEVDKAFAAMRKERADAFISLPQGIFSINRKRILRLAETSRLPSLYGDKIWAEAGGLMSYGPDTMRINRRAAWYVDKILKGTNPADLPVEQPSKFELVINLKTAKQIDLTIPPNVLARADRVIR